MLEPTRRILDLDKPVIKDVKKYRLEPLNKPEWDLNKCDHNDTYLKKDLESQDDKKESNETRQ